MTFFLIFVLGSNLIKAQSSFQSYSIDINEPIEMVPIEGGTFVLGEENENSKQVRVEVDSFWMGSYEITWEQYNQFSNEVMSSLENENLEGVDIDVDADVISLPTPPYVDMSFGMGTDGYPAISMTHYAASMFTKWLTAKTGEFYRLPTEAEWEYACKASNDNLTEQAWYRKNSNRGYQKVGTKEPNQYSLYDIPGNVAEWTTDEYYEDYITRVQNMGADPVTNPWFQPSDLYPRAARGASWMDSETEVSCHKRRGSNSDWKMLDPQIPKSLWWHTNAQFLGFRIVRPLNEPTPEEMKKYWPEKIDDFGM
jgi:formylglycine-generating enzyme required for sulfatase activity